MIECSSNEAFPPPRYSRGVGVEKALIIHHSQRFTTSELINFTSYNFGGDAELSDV